MKYDNKCAGCNKHYKNSSFATDSFGTLPLMYCDGVCETLYKNRKRMAATSHSTDEGKAMLARDGRLFSYENEPSLQDIGERVSKVKWQKRDYLTTEAVKI